ncbi:MAG: hypothetical protein LQ351_000866 [Letrouitia transgressa]|nr:MAG: hypothetical protein LQ351_000866 [Letrouitia transgressa]
MLKRFLAQGPDLDWYALDARSTYPANGFSIKVTSLDINGKPFNLFALPQVKIRRGLSLPSWTDFLKQGSKEAKKQRKKDRSKGRNSDPASQASSSFQNAANNMQESPRNKIALTQELQTLHQYVLMWKLQKSQVYYAMGVSSASGKVRADDRSFDMFEKN